MSFWRAELLKVIARQKELLALSGGTMTGPLLVSAGTVTAPGLAFAGDSNTGFYSPAADTIGIANAGVRTGVFDPSGRLVLGNGTGLAMNSVGSIPRLQVHGVDTDTSSAALFRWQNTDTPGTQFYLCRAKSSAIGTHGLIADGGGIGSYISAISDGVTFLDATSLQAVADGSQALNSTPAALNVRTNSGGTATTIKGRFTALGQFLMGHVASIAVGATSNQSPVIQAHGLSTDAQIAAYRWAASTGGATLAGVKSRGTTAGTHGVVSSGDTLLTIQAYGDDGTNYPPAGFMRFEVDATPGTGDMPGRWLLGITPDGAASSVEILRANNAGAISHRANAQVVVDANSHLNLRSYTVATVPSAAVAGQLIYVSNGTVNKRLAVSDGTNWRWPDGVIVS
ncbi:hypothetical protein NL532_24050 [Mesorhizobium sp. C120A]|uniref:hypothetical protein n=1 Tax=unclassified Mesorhizobium TaxID=325217 RepID=UPI0003CFBAAA|nr:MULTISPECIES: hypothetical protein [unclassified Mesorhizobium]ESZ60647.1 hypothetical protein X728_15005 [Mesorhizobium sp. L103C120A0]WJI43682.1 hypothetical protein NL532_24050 [Mesorhizobium sp. C120A]